MAYNMVVNTARRATDKPIPGKAYWGFGNQGLRLRGHLHVPHALNQGRSLRILPIAQAPTGALPGLLYRNRTRVRAFNQKTYYDDSMSTFNARYLYTVTIEPFEVVTIRTTYFNIKNGQYDVSVTL